MFNYQGMTSFGLDKDFPNSRTVYSKRITCNALPTYCHDDEDKHQPTICIATVESLEPMMAPPLSAAVGTYAAPHALGIMALNVSRGNLGPW